MSEAERATLAANVCSCYSRPEHVAEVLAPAVAQIVDDRVSARLAAVEALADRLITHGSDCRCYLCLPVHNLRAVLHSDPSEATCSGAGDCPAALHVHGCFADRDGAVCDDPSDHDLAPTSRPDVESPSVERGQS